MNINIYVNGKHRRRKDRSLWGDFFLFFCWENMAILMLRIWTTFFICRIIVESWAELSRSESRQAKLNTNRMMLVFMLRFLFIYSIDFLVSSANSDIHEISLMPSEYRERWAAQEKRRNVLFIQCPRNRDDYFKENELYLLRVHKFSFNVFSASSSLVEKMRIYRVVSIKGSHTQDIWQR